MLDREFHVSALVAGYVRNELTAEQEQELANWLNASKENQQRFDLLTSEENLPVLLNRFYELDMESVWVKLNLEISAGSDLTTTKRIKLWPRYAAAAILLIVGGLALYIYTFQNRKSKVIDAYAQDLMPGKKGATLTLSNGKQIKLSDAVVGQLAIESGVKISKAADGQVVYEIKDREGAKQGELNVLSTQRGETYQLRLPDGSLVWLNAGTTIKYPANFTALKERRIMLSGEAYFEVAKDKAHPFVVNSREQEVRVLGTHFDVNAYQEESLTKTTLLEGSVSVNAGASGNRVLKPGQQVTLTDSKLTVQEVDVGDAVAWKNGIFVFEGERLVDIMKEVSRWYDVDIEYRDEGIKQKRFSGSVSRFAKASQVLKKLELVEAVQFKIENNKIIVDKR